MAALETDVDNKRAEDSGSGSTPEQIHDVIGDSGKDSKANNVAKTISSDSKNVKGKGPTQEGEMDTANLHYEGSVCVYTDPDTKYQYQWDHTSQEWVPHKPSVPATLSNAPSSDQDFASKNYVFDGESYTYKDEATGMKYKWDNSKNSWILIDKKAKPTKSEKEMGNDDVEENDTDEEEEKNKNEIRQDMTSGRYDYDGENHTYTDPKDGTVYFWDRDRNAWFPKVDDDFMAQYQMNYGFVDNQGPKPDDKPKTEEKPDTADLKRKGPQEPQWFELDEKSNTKVYVNNLPQDITEQEFVEVMQKCGLVMRDVDSGNMKIKLYHEPGNPKILKGDGLCTYIKRESVELALKLLDGYDLRGHKLSVEVARFELKGAYDPTKKPKKRRRKDKEKIRKAQEKLFDWRPDKMRGERSKHERTVIIKNLFEPHIFDTDVGLILEFQQDLREEGSKCGNVRKVIIYDRHPEGIAQITFKEPEEADACVELFNNRWFNKRRITAETWDGKTKYRVAESAEERDARLAKWTKYLESEEGKKAALEANHGAGLECEGNEAEAQDSDDEEENKEMKQEDEGDKEDKTWEKSLETFSQLQSGKTQTEKISTDKEDSKCENEENDDARSSAGNSDKTEGRPSDDEMDDDEDKTDE